MLSPRRAVMLILFVGLVLSTSPGVGGAQALSAPSDARQPALPNRFRDGANHHLGDDSFVAAFGRAPTSHDSEAVRMKTHLSYVRALLAQSPATAPALANQRQALLSFLDDYIALGITPRNLHVTHRSPVFIDDDGKICAVGYLIDRSVGRVVAEQIAAAHRYDYLEDIAAAMPEIRAWIAASGFTLTELASIQPGYTAEIDQWQRWDKVTVGSGEDDAVEPAAIDAGPIRKGHMHGLWTRTSAAKVVVGQGRFSNGAGHWRSVYPNGGVLAEGNYVNDRVSGTWSFFHPSGRIAAKGGFRAGIRQGAWQFFYDDEKHTPIARGAFKRGDVVGTWQHFDASGKVFATTAIRTPPQWQRGSTGGHLLDVKQRNGVRFQSHQTDMGADSRYLATLFDKSQRIYIKQDGVSENGTAIENFLDSHGNRLTRTDSVWQVENCPWTKAQIKVAVAGDLAKLHGMLELDRAKEPVCSKPVALNAATSERIDALLQAHKNIKIAVPEFVTTLLSAPRPTVVSEPEENPVTEPDAAVDAAAATPNLITMLDNSMGWYIEWPHIDQQFIAAYRTLPGFRPGF